MQEKFKEYLKEGTTAAEAVVRLDRILALLRSEEGCPWDRAQTHKSLQVCMVEEAYEVNEAIDNEDWDNLEEELGDVLLQVLFHAGLAEENRLFDLKSVANRECEKMIRRHPHVFEKPDEIAENSHCERNNDNESIDRALGTWENVKRQEKKGTRTDSMMKLPKALPALRKSYKIQAKAADVGFDWDDVRFAFDKIDEEKQELSEAYQSGDKLEIQKELGDLLFAVVNVARFLDVDPEDALNLSSRKFVKRFSFIEESAQKAGRALEDMTLKEMDELWEQAKEQEEGTDF